MKDLSLENPIFIVGPGRSGTTLLRSLLSAHSRISIAPETQFMKWAARYGDIRRAPRQFESFWEDYTSWVRFKDLGVDPMFCRESIDRRGDYTFRNVFQTVLAAYRERAGKRRVGEKSPSHVRFLPELLEWFPEARVVVTKRDPRAVVASQLKTPYVLDRIRPASFRNGVFVGNRTHEAVGYAQDWHEIYNDILPIFANDPRVSVVAYEALVEDVEAQMRDICSFLDEDFEPTMLTDRCPETVPQPAGVTPSSKLEEWRRKHHAASLSTIDSGTVSKWKRDLNRWEVVLIEGRCAPRMTAEGYRSTNPHPVVRAGRFAAALVLSTASVESGARQWMRKVRSKTREMLTLRPAALFRRP